MPTAQEHHDRARELANRADWQAAEESARQALDVQPEYAPALHLLGSLAFRSGRVALAADCFARACDADPDEALYLSCRGAALKELGQFRQAVHCQMRALALRPGDAVALNNLGVALLALGRPADAAEAFRRAEMADPDEPAAPVNRAAALRRLGKLEEAVEVYRRTLARWPDVAQAHNNLGDALLSLGRVEEARQYFEQAVALEPGLVEALANLAEACRRLGRIDEADRWEGLSQAPSPLVEGVEVTPYDPAWPGLFAREAQLLAAALAGNDLVEAVEHVGSTAVAGLAAKPVIDLCVVVASLERARQQFAPVLQPLGYVASTHQGDFTLLMKWTVGRRSHNLHLTEHDSRWWRRLVLVRDYLRDNPDEATRYLELKRRLASSYRLDRRGYQRAKQAYLDRIVARSQAQRDTMTPPGSD